MSPSGTGSVPAECLAVDIGGTKVDVAVVTRPGDILERFKIEVSEFPQTLFDEIVRVSRNFITSHNVNSMGVACAGPMSNKGETASPLNIAQWRNFRLRDQLIAALDVAVNIDGDVKALALAEGVFGAARGVDSYFSMVLSTGIGGGVVMDGRLLNGVSGNAGHLGHVNVVPDGEQCSCGARGCLEAEVSGWAIAKRTGKPAQEATPEVRQRCAELFGRGVGTLMSVMDVNRCFVGGSVALGFGEEFFRTATLHARQMATMAYSSDLQILPTGLGQNGPLLGASLLCWQEDHA